MTGFVVQGHKLKMTIFIVSKRDHDSELNKIICDKILIAEVYLKVFNVIWMNY